MKARPLNTEEAALWARVVQSVQPLEGKAAFPVAPASSDVQMVTVTRVPSARAAAMPISPEKPNPRQPSNTLDGSWDRRLSRGLVQPDLAVDLHGYTLDTAYRTLDAGLAEAIGRGARMLLLVTGKPRASGSGRGAIRAAVGDWLAASRHASDIVAVRGAHPRHGGTGALYIVIRRRRERV